MRRCGPILGGSSPVRVRRHLVAGQGRHWQRIARLVVLLLCGLGVSGAPAQPATAASEYQVKAAFLFQFSHFVQWPAEAFESLDAPLVICVLGANPFGSALQEITADEWAYTHPLVVKHPSGIAELAGCHIVFVGNGEPGMSRQALGHLSGKSVLTVGDGADFSRNGGIIGLVTVDGKVRVQVNRSSALAAQLKISAKLLRVADLTD